MIDFAWREELSSSFGMVKRPVAQIFIKSAEGEWRPLTVYIDSGADASVLQYSIGELFGHNVKKGRRIIMKGFGEEELVAYLHSLEVKIGPYEINVKTAIVENDKVPNVLGRKDVFDLFDINFKGSKSCTRFLQEA